MNLPFKGLTWDHPRGFNALDKAGREAGQIQWHKQPLEGFESAPIAELCAAYDMVVLDHPHIGEAVAEGCLTRLETVFAADALDAIAAATIGSCFRSYEMDGSHWALPLDAASQVMAWQPAHIEQEVETWSQVAEFARLSGQVALSLAGPHAILSLMSIAASLDETLDLGNGGWIPDETCRAAFDLMQSVHAHANRAAFDQNPIGILEEMSRGDHILLCPLIYGYVNYSARSANEAVSFRNAPRARVGGRPGSILGGTGIGISAGCTITPELTAHLLWLMSPPVQTSFIPAHDGQPSARAAWSARGVNADVRDFYSATAETLETATLRPRHDGYIGFQAKASAYVRDALERRKSTSRVARDLVEMFTKSLPHPERTAT
ncbi:extracellular solute-binding protein [Yoonia sediminilitoris]|uniref:Multiple sugar transport system substrate-binding protein n=1 Tax=Yoonia sediminilitoris TaxID=1286148 RepID=A0A2T6KAK9_9RHOB|nr:extracellular solute-binding protein [Yoonia sediminilitoris]PUB11886.1 multiple sugar transport system substrate-binding protein [Yoonia sediminilitoris]RCW91963.1 carbohydrate ABC transporter substrate-binding protein (CUT1 family) [Yoonia sediminilitoris]